MAWWVNQIILFHTLLFHISHASKHLPLRTFHILDVSYNIWRRWPTKVNGSLFSLPFKYRCVYLQQKQKLDFGNLREYNEWNGCSIFWLKNVLPKIIFFLSWTLLISSLAWTGFKRSLTFDDLWNLSPTNSSSYIVPLFQRYWQNRVQKAASKNAALLQVHCCVKNTVSNMFNSFLSHNWHLF